MTELDEQLRKAVRTFWRTRSVQTRNQGTTTGKKDAGARAAVTGGAQMDGFVAMFRELLLKNGVSRDSIFSVRGRELPGYFRAEKQWDLLVVRNGLLEICIEFKSQVGSFGNNFNNRTEEALGNATDLWAAFREGAFRPSVRPWLGCLMLLESSEKSTRPVAVGEPHFKVFNEFRETSYAQRYEILLTKLVRERLYDGACLLMSERVHGRKGGYIEPSVEIGIENSARSLIAKAITGGGIPASR